MKSLSIALNRNTLKTIALLSMLLDHIGVFLIFPLYLDACIVDGMNLMGQLIPPKAKLLYMLYLFLRIIGRLALPIFAFFVVEGFFYTHHLKQYFLRMVVFAILSEIPYNLAITGSLSAPQYQNVLWTFAISIVMMWGLKNYVLKTPSHGLRILLTMITVSATALCSVSFDGGIGGICLIASMYLFRENKPYYWMGCMVSLSIITLQFMWIQWFAMIALILLEYYNRAYVKGHKYLFYLFYPAHLLLLWYLSLFLT